jgi:glycine/D-amino acid oxidase-like deaminating enzyme
MRRNNHPNSQTDKNHNLWHQTAAPTPLDRSPVLAQHTRCDVAIVGGGFTGLSAALHLAECGVDCVVLEAGTIGHGGSGRNVGLVNAGLWLPPDKLEKKLGKAVGERLNRVLGAGPELVFGLIEKYQINCEALRNGTLHLAHSAAGLRELESRHRQLSALGAPVTLHQRTASRELTGTAYYHCALQDRRAGTIQPLAYAHGLALAAQSQGARVFCRTPVQTLIRQGQHWQLNSPGGQVTADQVIIASNGYTDSLWPGLENTIIPIHFFQCATEPLSARQSAQVLPERHGCWDTGTLMMSMRKDLRGRLIFGSIGPTTGSDDGLLRGWSERMRVRLFPQLGPQTWTHVWHGRIAFTTDHLPRMHQLAPGVMTCIGYNGRGIAPGTLFGKAMAQLICGAPIEEFPLPVAPLRPILFNRLRALLTDKTARAVHFGQGRSIWASAD